MGFGALLAFGAFGAWLVVVFIRLTARGLRGQATLLAAVIAAFLPFLADYPRDGLALGALVLGAAIGTFGASHLDALW